MTLVATAAAAVVVAVVIVIVIVMVTVTVSLGHEASPVSAGSSFLLTVRVKMPLRTAPDRKARMIPRYFAHLAASVATGTPILRSLPLMWVEVLAVTAESIVAVSSSPAENVNKKAAMMIGVGGGGPPPPPAPLPSPLPILLLLLRACVRKMALRGVSLERCFQVYAI